MNGVDEFDLCGPLPGPGITLLEASAGTGKTYTIAGLVARYIAEGLPIDELLVITFTKAATGELRDRVRQRLVASLRCLELAVIDSQLRPEDPLEQLLIGGGRQQQLLRRSRISAALSAFDSATITTTHGFCETALTELGLAGDAELNPSFVTDADDIAQQIAADLYVQHFADRPSIAKEFSPDKALDLVRKVNADWDAHIEPTAETNELARARADFARQARAEIARRKRLAGIMTFDDQIGRLRDAVTNPVRGHHAVAALRSRYRVVLVDEFQDTDLSQWTIMQEAFGDGERTTLLLIGDPKQAIYAFRGADVFAYLAAADHVTNFATLATNFRSDPAVLAGLDEIFRECTLGDDRIAYRSVRARPGAVNRIESGQAVRLRIVRDDAPIERTKFGVASAEGRTFVAGDVAADIVAQLRTGRWIPESFAVLTNSHREAAEVQNALLARGVPAVVRSNESIFLTPAAQAFLRLFQACESPNSARLIRRLAVSDMIGWSAQRLAEATDQDLSVLHESVAQWAELIGQGIAGVYAAIKRDTDLLERLLSQPGGERLITDLDQIAELANSHSGQHRANAATMAAWMATRIDQANRVEEDARVRRLDTDAQAVQVITLHASKGLEFDVVYCPFMWLGGGSSSGEIYTFHDNGRRVVYVGGKKGEQVSSASSKCSAELRGEALRKAYVAMTRAKHELVLTWADCKDSQNSALGRLIWQGSGAAIDNLDHNDLDRIFGESAYIELEDVDQAPSQERWEPQSAGLPSQLQLRTLCRSTDSIWQRTSFTGLTRAAHEAHMASPAIGGSEPDTTLTVDEPETENAGSEHQAAARADQAGNAEQGSSADESGFAGTSSAPGSDLFETRDSRELMLPFGDAGSASLRQLISPMAACPSGANFGSFVHAVYEQLDFATDDLPAEVDRALDDVSRWWRTDIGDPAVLREGLVASLRTPLGADLNNLRLADLSRRDRIDEMGFEFALAGGESPSGDFSVTDLAGLLDKHLPPDDVLRPYIAHLRAPELQAQVHGYLSGSIDLVLRSTDSGGNHRYSIADYKTNRLGPGEVTAWDYRPQAVAQAVFEANYPVQFLLYLVALHRYLRWRLPDYDPASHLGPVKYLFVRGMFGPDNPLIDGQPAGVFSWQPSADLIVELSQLLAEGV